MRADRLLSIMLLLQTRTQVPAGELAERLEVSVRTIYRDVEALSAAGVPVWAERGRAGGIRLLPGYRTDVTGLTADEARALFVTAAAKGTHQALGLGGAFGSALRKVMAALPAPHRPAAERTSERILVDPTRWMCADRRAEVEVGELQRAVFTDRRLRLTYRHSGNEEPDEYTVDPYGLVSKAGAWYVAADLDGEPRLFRAERVRAAEVTGEPVRRRPGVSLAEVWERLRDQVERRPHEIRVTCRLRRSHLDMFVRLQGHNLTAPPEDDGTGEWVVAELAYPAVMAVRSLLCFVADVEVLSPPEARAELAAAAAKLAGLYGDA